MCHSLLASVGCRWTILEFNCGCLTLMVFQKDKTTEKAVPVANPCVLNNQAMPQVFDVIERIREKVPFLIRPLLHLLSVIHRIERQIITFRDGPYSTTVSSACGEGATFPSAPMPALESECCTRKAAFADDHLKIGSTRSMPEADGRWSVGFRRNSFLDRLSRFHQSSSSLR